MRQTSVPVEPPRAGSTDAVARCYSSEQLSCLEPGLGAVRVVAPQQLRSASPARWVFQHDHPAPTDSQPSRAGAPQPRQDAPSMPELSDLEALRGIVREECTNILREQLIQECIQIVRGECAQLRELTHQQREKQHEELGRFSRDCLAKVTRECASVMDSFRNQREVQLANLFSDCQAMLSRMSRLEARLAETNKRFDWQHIQDRPEATMADALESAPLPGATDKMFGEPLQESGSSIFAKLTSSVQPSRLDSQSAKFTNIQRDGDTSAGSPSWCDADNDMRSSELFDCGPGTSACCTADVLALSQGDCGGGPTAPRAHSEMAWAEAASHPDVVVEEMDLDVGSPVLTAR